MAATDVTPTMAELAEALRQSWSGGTSYAGEQWPPDNPARAQCVVSSLVVQDYLGGDLVRYAVRGEGVAENHVCNRLDGVDFDTTASQYQTPVSMTEIPFDLGRYPSVRAKLLADEETAAKYTLLARRVRAALAWHGALGPTPWPLVSRPL